MTQYAVTNPATGEVLETFPTATDEQIQAALDAAQRGYEEWREVPLERRQEILREVAASYDRRKDELAAIIATEMGKPPTFYEPKPQGREAALLERLERFRAVRAERAKRGE